MKTVLIIVGIVCVICCGGAIGLFFITKGAVDNVMKEARAFGDQSVTAITKNWSMAALKERSAPELLSQQSKELETVIAFGEEKLGPMKSFEGNVDLQIEAKQSAGQKGYATIPYHATITCEKGKATVDLGLIKRDDKDGWKILSINVVPVP